MVSEGDAGAGFASWDSLPVLADISFQLQPVQHEKCEKDMWAYEKDILKMVKSCQTSLVKAATGKGKTSQSLPILAPFFGHILMVCPKRALARQVASRLRDTTSLHIKLAITGEID